MEKRRKIVIAVDGHSSCGKSTAAKAVAKRLNYIYIDSGAMYRTVTLFCLRNNLIINGIVDTENLLEKLDEVDVSFRLNEELKRPETMLNGEVVEDEIRRIEVSSNVSYVSSIRFVREKMVLLQKAMGKDKGIVMDGRDIGTVVFPDAELKIFMTADVDVRAKRRYDELTKKGENVRYEEIRENVAKRDYIDENREESPLRRADDALILDNSYLTQEEQLDWIINKCDNL